MVIGGLGRDPLSEPIPPSLSLSQSLPLPLRPEAHLRSHASQERSSHAMLLAIPSHLQASTLTVAQTHFPGLRSVSCFYVLALQSEAVKITTVSKYIGLYSLSTAIEQITTTTAPSNNTHLFVHTSINLKSSMAWLGSLLRVSGDWNQGSGENPLLGSFQLLQNQGSHCCRSLLSCWLWVGDHSQVFSRLSLYLQGSNGTLKASCGLNLWLRPPAWESPLPLKGSCDFVRQTHLGKSPYFKVSWIWILIISAKSLHSSTYIRVWLNNPWLRIWRSRFKILPDQVKKFFVFQFLHL